MIVLQADVWPHGRRPEHPNHQIVSLIIANDGTGSTVTPDSGGVGNYDVYEGIPERRELWRHVGRIEGLPRDREHRTTLLVRALEFVR